MIKRKTGLALLAALTMTSASCMAKEPDYSVEENGLIFQSEYIQSIIDTCLKGNEWLRLGNKPMINLPELTDIFNINSLITVLSDVNLLNDFPYISAGNPIITVQTCHADNNEYQSDTSAVHSDMADQILEIVNRERSSYGFNTLVLDSRLVSMAQYKAEDMASYGFSHEGSYGNLSELIAMFNISGTAHGENIAMNRTSAEEVMNDWMNSEGHRANILNGDYTKLGVGYYKSNGSIYWVQEFSN